MNILIRALTGGALILGLATQAFAETPMTAKSTTQQEKKLKAKITKKVELGYLLHLPSDYKARGSKRWPLILFLHGAGERGTNLSLVAVHGPPKLVLQRPDFPFIVVSPQCPNNQDWDNDSLLALLDEVVKKHKVDKSRIYLTGLSMGGFGTWSLGLSNPERFAAIAPICGGGDSIGVLLSTAKQQKAFATLGIWAFHGAKDPVVKLSESERMVKMVNDHGGHAELTVYPEAQHDSWTETYSNPRLFEWFLEHQRK